MKSSVFTMCTIFSLCIILMVSIVVAEQGDCATPAEGVVYLHSVHICSGTYDLPLGVAVEGDDIIMTCDGTVFQGDGSGVGITVAGENFQMTGCEFEGYETKVNYVIGDAEDFPEEESLDILIEEDDPILYVTEEEPPKPKIEYTEIHISDLNSSYSEWFNNVPSPGFYLNLGIHKADLVEATIHHNQKKVDGGYIYSTRIEPLEGVYTIYEVIPKQLMKKDNDPLFLDAPFITAVKDPVKVMFEADLSNGLEFSYKTDRNDRKSKPVTYITTEAPGGVVSRFKVMEDNTQRNRVFYLFVLLFFLGSYHMEKNLGK